MSNTLNLNDITTQIRQYIRQIKENKKGEFNTILPEAKEKEYTHYSNDLRSNINRLDGNNKFSLHNITSEDRATTTGLEYASAAYNHLSSLEEKHKVVIDFMHKNNKNFDVKV